MMKTLRIAAVLVFGFCSMANGALTLSVNGVDVESIVLKAGQTCSIEISSDDASTYSADVLVETSSPVGPFLEPNSIETAAGTLASESGVVIKGANLHGYYITADGGPTPEVHFIYSFTPNNPGETELWLYNDTVTSVLDSISITVLTSEVGTAFTYQGRLVDAADAANGEYDFIFTLYDSPSYGVQIGAVMDMNNVDVVDGHFAVELDFGSAAFAGDGDWLETRIRAGASGGSYTTLSPRQRITPTPYAIYAARSDWNNLVNMPADIADGDDDTDTILTESQVETYIVNDTNSGYLPYDNGTKLVDSGFRFDGFNTSLGAATHSSRKFYLYTDSDIEALYGINANTSTTGNRYALHGIATGNTNYSSYGVRGSSESSTGYNYGVYGATTTASSGNNYGIYGSASNSGTGDAYAGYFNGDVSVNSSSECALYVENSNPDGVRYALDGIATGNTIYVSYGVRGSSESSTGFNYGVYGITTTASIGNNYGVYGSASNSGAGSAFAGYFNGDVRVIGDLNPNFDLEIVRNDGFEVAIGTGVDNDRKLNVYTDSDLDGLYVENANPSGIRYALRGITSGSGGVGTSTGVRGESSGAINNYGVHGEATDSATGKNVGVYGYAVNSGPGPAYAGYFRGSEGSAYAGYFKGRVEVEGDLTCTGNFFNLSDIRLKENIAPLKNASEKISALKAIYFNYKDKSPSNRRIGVIAQDVEKVLPELVSTNSDGYKAVDYTKLTPVLIEAVKELINKQQRTQEQLDAMSKENQELKKHLASIESMLSEQDIGQKGDF